MKNFSIVIVAFGAIACLSGCGAQTPAQTADQVKTFKGGPMPPDWQKKMAEMRGNVMKNAAASASKASAEAATSAPKS